MVHSNVLSDFSISVQFPAIKGLGVDSWTPTFLISGIGDWGDIHEPCGSCEGPRLVYCLVGVRISSGSITDLTKYQGQVMRSLKYIKSGLSGLFPYQSYQSIVCTMELAINTIWYGAGETIRWCIAWPLGQPACEIRSSVSAPRFSE